MKELIALSGVLVAGFFYSRGAAAYTNAEIEPVGEQVSKPYELVNWSLLNWFDRAEFVDAEGVDMGPYMDPEIVYALDEFRGQLGCPVIISPALGSMARFDQGARNSQHYAVGRMSTAIDVMPIGCGLSRAYEVAAGIEAIGGIGVYPDWQPRPGLHLDTRPRTQGRIAEWMGYRQSDGTQAYAGVDWGIISQKGAA